MDELYRKLLAQLEEGQDTVLAFITEGDGSIPRTTGAYMLVGREGRIFGTIGGGNLEYQAVLHAQELVQEKKSEYREYDLGTGEGKGLGMVCGGRVKVCFYFMNGAHGEAESLAQALAAQEQYRSYWIFFCAGRNRHPRAGKRSVGNASGGTGKSGPLPDSGTGRENVLRRGILLRRKGLSVRRRPSGPGTRSGAASSGFLLYRTR